MCEAYLKHHEDKQNCVHASAGKNEARNNVCVCARSSVRLCVRERGRERERNLKTKGALLESHCMYSYGFGTRVNLRHMCERHNYPLRH